MNNEFIPRYKKYNELYINKNLFNNNVPVYHISSNDIKKVKLCFNRDGSVNIEKCNKSKIFGV